MYGKGTERGRTKKKHQQQINRQKNNNNNNDTRQMHYTSDKGNKPPNHKIKLNKIKNRQLQYRSTKKKTDTRTHQFCTATAVSHKQKAKINNFFFVRQLTVE